MTDTQEIKNRLDLVDVVQDYGVQLRKSGRNYSGFCPFHPNTRTPAFYVFPETQTWRCFGACAEGGDVFSFVMKKNGWDFKETLVDLARRAGVTLEETRPKDAAHEAAEERQVALLDAASNYYHQLLLHAPQAEVARRYVAGRALNDDTVAAYRLGFALDSWDAAKTHFTGQGYSEDELMGVGLLTEHEERHTRYDRFRGRLMIPIRDLDGRVVGFGARTLDPDGVPKYLNSPQTALFDKGNLIFGLDMARRHIREAREVVLVEGYLDVMTAWQHGFRNVVAQMGTSLTETQLRLLQKQSKRFVMALDPDAAGAKATLRSLQLARETLDRELDVRFNARGLVQLEGRLKADIRVVTLPEGQDPDKLIRTDPTAWPKLLAEARPVVDYVIQVVAVELEPGDAKGKSAAAAQVLPLIGDIADPIERDHYLKKLARTLGIDEGALRQAAERQKKEQRPRGTEPKSRPTNAKPPAGRARTDQGSGSGQHYVPPEPDAPPDDFGVPPDSVPSDGTPSDGAPSFGAPPRATLSGGGSKIATRRLRNANPLEENFLRQCLEHPGALSTVNYLLSRNKQRDVSADDFTRIEDKALLAIVAQRATVPTVATIEELCDSLDSVLAQRVKTLFAKPSSLKIKLERLPDTLALSVLDWRLEKIREHNTILKQLLPSGGQTEPGDELTRSYLDQVQEMGRINRARDAMSATSRRRAEEGHGGRRSR
ncbi:MAG TPA: DNA primase [Promineifilum sp.]|nr:DNA primase [Promineifilum sp.]